MDTRLILLLLVLVQGCSKHIANDIFDSDIAILKPYVWLNSEFSLNDTEYQKRLDYGDPNQLTMMLFREYLEEKDLGKLSSHVDQIIKKWRLNEPDGHLNYTFPYGKLPAGWRSGMDSWSFPLFLLGLSQKTQDEKYKVLAYKLIQQARKSASDRGTLWRPAADECWFSEYAWDGMTINDEFYVLNGHLLALQSAKMLSNATGDPEIEDLYRCGLKLTVKLANQFLIGDTWAYYMLNAPTINQTHYVIYEIMQFDALYSLDKQKFYRTQSAIRRDLLEKHF